MNLEFVVVDDETVLLRLTDGNAQVHHQERVSLKDLEEKFAAAGQVYLQNKENEAAKAEAVKARAEREASGEAVTPVTPPAETEPPAPVVEAPAIVADPSSPASTTGAAS